MSSQSDVPEAADAVMIGASAADAVVIGAGVIGSAVALELARRGMQTTVIDKLPAAGYGSTSSSSAIVRCNYSTAAGVAMAWEAWHYWKNWAEHIGPAGAAGDMALINFAEVPIVSLLKADDPPMRSKPFFDRFGVPYDELSLAQVHDRYPHLDLRVFGPPVTLEDHEASFWGEPTAKHAGAIVMYGSGYVSDPQLAAQNLMAAATHAGASFRFNTTVTSIDQRDGRVAGVSCADGSVVQAPIVVNVAGPYSSIINQMAGVAEQMAMPTRALRREVFVVPAPDGVDFDDYESVGVMSGDVDIGVYFRPERGNNVLIGSAEPDCDELEWIDDPDNYRRTMTEDEYQLLVLRTARRLPGLPVPQTKRGLVDLYDATADWTPIYDRSSLDGFYMACGSSGNQFKNAPVAGHCMAELIMAVEAGHDHDASPVVVTGTHTGNEIDMGTFTRNRVLTADSATSVLG